MKKLRLDLKQLDSAEILTRTQLKQVIGGFVLGSGSDTLPKCNERGYACYMYVNCCSGLWCGDDHNCH